MSADHVSDPPHLWQFRVSHYNEKVRWFLDHKRWPHRRTTLVPGFHIPRVRGLTGQHKVPALALGGEVLIDSTSIMAELERLRPDPPLFPSDAGDRARAAALEDYFDDEVAPALRRLFWDAYLKHPGLAARMATDGASAWTRAGWLASYPVLAPAFRSNVGLSAKAIRRARERLVTYFDRVVSELGPSGYLVGDRFGVADLTAAAVLSALVRPPEFPYPLPEPVPAELHALQASVAEHAGYRWVESIYARHRGASAEIA